MELPNLSNLAWAPQRLMKNLIAAVNNKDEAHFIQIIKINDAKNYEVIGSVPINFKISSLAWSEENFKIEESTLGAIIVGTSEGAMKIYNANKMITDPYNSLMFEENQIENHSIECIEINPFKQNLIGLSGNEVYIYNLNNCKDGNALFKPGKVNPHEGNSVTSIAWNKNVQFILASASDNCMTTVWDLKQNKPVYHFSEPASVIESFSESQFSSSLQRKVIISWNPEIATQIAVAKCNSVNSSINLWDLRAPSKPALMLNTQNSKLLTSITWCNHDSTFLSATTNENKYFLWNSKTGECILEDKCLYGHIKWSNFNPGLFSISNSINSQIFSFFEIPGKIGNDKIAPKWLESKKGICSFGFGGKLIQKVKKDGRQLQISIIKANSELINKAKYFDSLLREKNISDICQIKISSKNLTPEEQCQWKLMKSIHTKNTNEICESLGLDPKSVIKEWEKSLGKNILNNNDPYVIEPNEKSLTSISQDDAENFFSNLGKEPISIQKEKIIKSESLLTGVNSEKASSSSNWNEGIAKTIKENLIIGNLEGAIDASLKCGRYSEALFFASYGSDELIKATREKFIKLSNDNYLKSIIKPLLDNNYEKIYYLNSELNWKEIIIFAINHNSDNGISVALDICNILVKSKNIEGAITCCIVARCFDKAIELMNYQLKEKIKNLTASNYIFELQKVVEKAYSLKEVLENYEEKNQKYNELIGEFCTVLVNNGLEKEAFKLMEQINSKSTEKCYRIKNINTFKYSPSKTPFIISNIVSKFHGTESSMDNTSKNPQNLDKITQKTSPNFQTLNKEPPLTGTLKYDSKSLEEKKEQPKPISQSNLYKPGVQHFIPNLSSPIQNLNTPFLQKENPPFSQDNSFISNSSRTSVNFQKPLPTSSNEKANKTIFNPGQSKVETTKEAPKYISSSLSGFTPPPIKLAPSSFILKNKEQKKPSPPENFNPINNQASFAPKQEAKNEKKPSVISPLQKQESSDEYQIDFTKIPEIIEKEISYLRTIEQMFLNTESHEKKRLDFKKKISSLYRKLTNGEITPEILQILKNLIHMLQINNLQNAFKLHEELTIKCWENNKDWLRILKRIIQYWSTSKK